ncbi:P-loop NTPase [archaeon]|jgi:septum site-determining protein MinD|nr:P-loop NTPase [archaeon]MBT4373912.1 P-loop NTPase [archaeon]MBT4532189.1 P-loop NTPase [archaeon]MBT7001142.1 P-loop NTPase [archaeon]MBT7282031.1 P-loop NTPase [archaeon]
MSKVIVITSGKGGVGKTTSAVNIGAAINYFGGDVLVIDGNLSTPNVGIHLGSPEVPINLNHILLKKADPIEGVYEHESGLKIIPSSLSIKELEKLKPEKLKEFKNEFKKISEYVIVDSAAGLGGEAMAAIKMADELILVTNPEMPAITDALKAIKMAEKEKIPVMGVIMTKVKKNKIEMQPETVKEMLEVPILGMVPEDISISEALNTKDAVIHTHPKSKAARAYKEIAAQLLGITYDSNLDKETIWEKIKKVFGKKEY